MVQQKYRVPAPIKGITDRPYFESSFIVHLPPILFVLNVCHIVSFADVTADIAEYSAESCCGGERLTIFLPPQEIAQIDRQGDVELATGHFRRT